MSFTIRLLTQENTHLQVTYAGGRRSWEGRPCACEKVNHAEKGHYVKKRMHSLLPSALHWLKKLTFVQDLYQFVLLGHRRASYRQHWLT
eukprot:1160136-Pelagomonas_calceolata.AAC.2